MKRGLKMTKDAELFINKALEIGFETAKEIDTGTLAVRKDVREMCAADKCHAFGKNWTCPPACGELSECSERINKYKHGIIVQTTGKTEKSIDTKAYRHIEALHHDRFVGLTAFVRATHPEALCLGAGGCRICKVCTYPNAPCRFPDKSYSSMEAYGLFVTQVCRDNGINYYYGEKTMTYTSCILF